MTLRGSNIPLRVVAGGVFVLSLISFVVPASAQSGAVVQDLERRLNEIEQESAQRNGSIERLQFAVQAVAKRIDEIQKDYDLRLNELEKKIQTLQTRPMASAAQPVAGTAIGVTGTVRVMSVTLPIDASSTQVYNKAFAYLTATQYPQAESWLQAFTQRFPNDPLADHAYYWLGESRLVQNNPAGAAQAFRDGLRVGPKSPKVPDLLLKLGVALEQLNQSALAKASWDKLVKDFPNSPQAARAKENLLKLKL
jgi:tol-pal system protein YbgF